MNRRARKWLAALALCAFVPGCPTTSFTGSPRYPGGAPACFQQCAAENMRMAQFVYVGAYSSACVCEVIPLPVQGAPAALERGSGASGATTAAAVGVVLQMREEEERTRQHWQQQR